MAIPQLQYSCLEDSHGQGSLVGYSPQGHKESDMTENTHTHIHPPAQSRAGILIWAGEGE